MINLKMVFTQENHHRKITIFNGKTIGKPQENHRKMEVYSLVNVNKKLWKDPPFLMGKSTISMAMFNSFLYVYQMVFGNITTQKNHCNYHPERVFFLNVTNYRRVMGIHQPIEFIAGNSWGLLEMWLGIPWEFFLEDLMKK